MSEEPPKACPVCGKKVPKVDPKTASELLARHLAKHKATQQDDGWTAHTFKPKPGERYVTEDGTVYEVKGE